MLTTDRIIRSPLVRIYSAPGDTETWRFDQSGHRAHHKGEGMIEKAGIPRFVTGSLRLDRANGICDGTEIIFALAPEEQLDGKSKGRTY